MAEQRKKLRLGELLVQQGLITTDQLSIVLAEQRHNNIPMGRLLVRLGFVTESAIRDVMARTIGQESIDLAQVVADPEALRLVPQDFARRNRVLPIAYDPAEQLLTVATTEIFNVVAMDQLRAVLGSQIEIKTQLAAEAQLEDRIDQFYGYELSVDGILKEIETGEIDYESLQAVGGGDEYTQPMVRLVNALLVDAVKRGASDIHFEPEYAFLRIRYRIDGVLETVRSLHKTYLPGITVRVKVVSNMNIAETRAPQDGRLSLTLNGRPVDFRVSTQPTIYGENIVLRVLDREKSIISLDRMRLAKDALDKIELMLARPEGILIVTGPTGSGKTTTLYSLLAQVNDETVNIMTLEDPVEYPLTLMRQTSVSEVARMDFADGIRSIMRQDPDIILVGEVRDKETAEMAFRAAMTGHQVFTTLHTNSALGAFRGCSTSASSPTSWRATSSASSLSAWCGCCATTARRPTPRPRKSGCCSARWATGFRTCTAPWAARTATTRATGAAPRSWNCWSWTATSTSWWRAAPPPRSCVPRRWPRASARSPRRGCSGWRTASPAWPRWRARSTLPGATADAG